MVSAIKIEVATFKQCGNFSIKAPLPGAFIYSNAEIMHFQLSEYSGKMFAGKAGIN